ncbi:hypothetical protein [Parvularcula dongshanensis]|uniref:Uncharacterized protein n=1 Tax=Parvularcula dongshanensis TaxID=1173995 RepID=A0A840I5X5_9PROT|nr:hypothetical protein [Parvularcula dongshanensis]MBB4660346.1 hypothetical protein [Parvularcula dongshanensis]
MRSYAAALTLLCAFAAMAFVHLGGTSSDADSPTVGRAYDDERSWGQGVAAPAFEEPEPPAYGGPVAPPEAGPPVVFEDAEPLRFE